MTLERTMMKLLSLRSVVLEVVRISILIVVDVTTMEAKLAA
jgi:hypothetical protein